MASAYKAIQSKAMHNGGFIGYAIMGAHQYTTNGQIMVRHIAKEDELKTLKNQYDRRSDGSQMFDMTFVLDKLQDSETITREVSSGEVEEWTNEAGLSLTKVTVPINPENNIVMSVQSVYLDYVNALFDDIAWWVTQHSVFAANSNKEILAVIAPVKEITNETTS